MQDFNNKKAELSRQQPGRYRDQNSDQIQLNNN